MSTFRTPRVSVLLALCLLLLASATTGLGVSRTWTGGVGDWSTGGNWSPVGTPAAGDDVVISTAADAVTVSSATPYLSSLTITNAARLIFTNWSTSVSATNITIATNAVVTHMVCDTNPVVSNTNRVYLICSNLTIAAGGSINADMQGFTNEYINANAYGQGPGRGYTTSGAGYGGKGAGPRGPTAHGNTYGSASAPVEPGSAGGTTSNGGSNGGNGGGVVRIKADGQVRVDGTVTANGEDKAGLYGGGAGSGGSVYIDCDTFVGSGRVSANAGHGIMNRSDSSGGGGGRIAVHYAPVSQAASPGSTVTFSALPGWNLVNTDNIGGLGSLDFPDHQLLGTVLEHAGRVTGFASWSVDSLTLSNGWVQFAEPGFVLTATNDVVVTGTSGVNDGHLEFGASSHDGYTRTSDGLTGATVRIGGSLIVTNAAAFHVFSGETNGTAYGALVAVTNDIVVDSGCWVYPYSQRVNGGSPRFTVSNLTVHAGGRIDADGKGYYCSPTTPYGPGKGVGRDGGGHGGYGGDKEATTGWAANGGKTYDRVDTPVLAGSAAGVVNGRGAHGGGVVRVIASGVVTVDGTITADGLQWGAYNGGGAGGSVYIDCVTFAGSGVVKAAGCNGVAGSNGGGGGGGGRIAIHYDKIEQAGQPVPTVHFSAVAGHATQRTLHDYFPADSDIGTLYFPDTRFLTEIIRSDGELWIPGFTNWVPSSLTISNAWFRFATQGTTGFVLNVANDLTVIGDPGISGDLTHEGRFDVLPFAQVTVGGDLILQNGADVHIHAGSTNGATDYGALLDVAGSIDLTTNSWMYLYSEAANGGSPLVRVSTLSISASAGIDADGKGFDGQSGGYGYGPGRSLSRGGAGYGGLGHAGNPGTPGGTYGDSNAPVHAGSSGGNSGASWYGGAGGGSVRIEATGNVDVNGTLTADGTKGTQYSGPGSGGGIYIMCETITGDPGAVISADGSRAHTLTVGGGGGGGRIAVWSGEYTFAGSMTATGGLGYGSAYGSNGTVVTVSRAPAITNLFATNITETAVDVVGDLLSTAQTPTEVYCYWGLVDKLDDKNAWATNDYLGTNGLGVITNSLTGLESARTYYYRFYATNLVWHDWGVPTASFSTPGGGPTVNNEPGAGNITDGSAVLRGIVTGGFPDPAAYFCWGDEPGGTATGNWDHVDYASTTLGAISNAVSGLLANKTYYYRCYVTNADGPGWAATYTNFTTAQPTMWISDPTPITEGDAGSQDFDFTVSLSVTSAVDVTVQFTAADGWATTAGGDYTATNGTLTFAASNSAAEIVRVPVIGDTTDELPYEDLYVNLSVATDATLTDAQGYGRIWDNDDTSQTKSWTGSGNWMAFTNWSPIGRPGPLDDVVIGSGTCFLTNDQSVTSVTVANGATLTFSNWVTALTATDITVQNGGTITHAQCKTDVDPTNTNRVHLLCAALTVDAGGEIDVKGKGYISTGTTAYGPGVGTGGTRPGGGYGGHAGDIIDATGRPTYGDPLAPVHPGSAGKPVVSAGGFGGGVVRVEASGAVTVNGTITADGTRNSQYAGGGSGGSIYIDCDTVQGSGSVTAAGSRGGSDTSNGGGGGGGGRIAVHYNTTSQGALPVPGLHVSVAGGYPSQVLHDHYPKHSDIGTLYFPDTKFVTETMTWSGEWHVPGFTSWSPATLTIASNWVRFASNDFTLAVAGHVTIIGGPGISADPTLEGRLELPPGSSLTVGGNLALTDGGDLHVLATSTNVAGGNGASVAVSRHVQIGSNSWIYPYSDAADGGSPEFSADTMTIAAGGGFDADGKGFFGTDNSVLGYGPGGATGRSGAGYGGVGGAGSDGIPGGTYGSSNAPVDPGSCGGWNGTYPGGDGGGVVRVAVDGVLILDGSITAKGYMGPAHAGAGSGGSIYLQCRRFTAATNALLSVRGGDGGSAASSKGGGGGGRIAVWRVTDTSPAPGVLVDTDGGTGIGTGTDGSQGTYVVGVLPTQGSVFLVR